MPEIVKNMLTGVSLLGILGDCPSYPRSPKNPFKEDRRVLAEDRRLIERSISRIAKQVRYDAQTNRSKGYSAR